MVNVLAGMRTRGGPCARRVIEAPLIRPTSSGFVDSAAARRHSARSTSVASRECKSDAWAHGALEYEHLGRALDETAELGEERRADGAVDHAVIARQGHR